MDHEQEVEQEIQTKGLVAPRVTPADVDAAIDRVQYHVFQGTMKTVCEITLKNGFSVSGESACASPDNFDQQIGEQIAKRNAREEIWPLLGYALKEKLHMLNKVPPLMVDDPLYNLGEVQTYIGTKVVHAVPMTRQEYNDFRGWVLPVDEDGSDAGFLVQYTDGGKGNVPGFSGYISWSPSDVFLGSYGLIGSPEPTLPKTFLDRMREERDALNEKREKLKQFVDSEKFNELEFMDRELLVIQHNHMVHYLETLDMRIARAAG